MLYAVTIFLGSFLLFQIEPVIGKFILPWFGGGPGVWATCLLFFQSALVLGYAYAHGLSRWLPPKRQAVVHGVLLAASLALLPVIPGDRWKPDPQGNPTGQILALLAVNLGLPYVLLAATGPLVQEWFRRGNGGRSPYRLYALSNAGSLLALLSYPFFFEWEFTRRAQAVFWAWGMAGFAVCCGCCGFYAAQRSGNAEAAEPPLQGRESSGGAASTVDRGAARVNWAWFLLPALASVLLLATTNKLCLDLAAVPFLWVLPLALYLVSFIVCFDHPRWYHRGVWSALSIAAVGCIAKLLFIDDAAPLLVQVGVYSVALLAGCMVCHGELYRLRPEPRGLTGFYLAVAIGGAVGGLLVAVVAPAVFRSFAELPLGYWLLSAVVAAICLIEESHALAVGTLIGAIAALFLIPAVATPEVYSLSAFVREFRRAFAHFSTQFLWEIGALLLIALVCFGHWRRGWTRGWTLRSALFVTAVCAALGGAFGVNARTAREDVARASRNFFGLLTVFDYEPYDPQEHYHLLMHGKITHGLEYTDADKARWPTTYYGTESGVGRAIASLPSGQSRRLGLVGLGTGTLAAYVRGGDTMRIYEINPQVEALSARPDSLFRYVPDSPGKVDVMLGDARLTIEREVAEADPPRYDVLALDAFSSDAIPVHLLTREAFMLYLRELAPDGILAVHISNRFFDLEPVVTQISRSLGLHCVLIEDSGNDDDSTYETSWMLVARRAAVLQRPLIAKVATPGVGDRNQRLWTDDYASLLSVLR